MKDINIVIVNYKMKNDIEKCLVSLNKDIVSSGLDVNIVVVDNNSGDEVGKMILQKFQGVNLILQNKNNGFGKAQNLGIKSCEAKYYFALNPDTYFEPGKNIIRKLYDFMENHPKIGMIGPKITYPDGTLQYSCYRFPSF